MCQPNHTFKLTSKWQNMPHLWPAMYGKILNILLKCENHTYPYSILVCKFQLSNYLSALCFHSLLKHLVVLSIHPSNPPWLRHVYITAGEIMSANHNTISYTLDMMPMLISNVQFITLTYFSRLTNSHISQLWDMSLHSQLQILKPMVV